MLSTIKYGHLTLDCEYDYDPPDFSVGDYGAIFLHAVYVEGNDILELLSDKTIRHIENDLFQVIRG